MSFFTFLNNSRSKQNKKNPEHPFLDIGKLETYAKFQQKILSFYGQGWMQLFKEVSQKFQQG